MSDSVQIPSKLLSNLSSASELVHKHDFFRVVSHYDADGISAAGIICQTLHRAGKQFQVTLLKNLNEKEMKGISEMETDCLIIADMGASYIQELEKLNWDVIVLDHHRSEDESDKIHHINPHLYGIDGMTAACGASMSMLFSLAVSESNWDLVQLAVAGMAGDRQHMNGMIGINEYLTVEAEKRGLLKKITGSLIPPGSLADELFLSTDPFIAGVSGEHEGVYALLEEAGIPIESRFENLEPEQRRKLSTLISLILLDNGVTLGTMMEVSRPRFLLSEWGMDAEGLASLFNACGRMDLEGMGVALSMGDPESLKESLAINTEYRQKIIESVMKVKENGLTALENIQFFHSHSSGFTGIMCGIAMQFFADPDKPTFGLSRKDENVRISGRATWKLLDRGVDLSLALRDACKNCGGSGGGHRIASGGAVPIENEERFLTELDAIIGNQLITSK